MKLKSIIYLFTICLLIISCQSEDPVGPWFGNGIHNGWADQNSIVIWTRLTKTQEMNYGGARFVPLSIGQRQYLNKSRDGDSIHSAQIPEGLNLDDMEGSCPGMDGQVRLSYYPEGLEANRIERSWQTVKPDNNHTKQWRLDGLLPGTRYKILGPDISKTNG